MEKYKKDQKKTEQKKKNHNMEYCGERLGGDVEFGRGFVVWLELGSRIYFTVLLNWQF